MRVTALVVWICPPLFPGCNKRPSSNDVRAHFAKHSDSFVAVSEMMRDNFDRCGLSIDGRDQVRTSQRRVFRRSKKPSKDDLGITRLRWMEHMLHIQRTGATDDVRWWWPNEEGFIAFKLFRLADNTCR